MHQAPAILGIDKWSLNPLNYPWDFSLCESDG
jgi:hypothetical protein